MEQSTQILQVAVDDDFPSPQAANDCTRGIAEDYAAGKLQRCMLKQKRDELMQEICDKKGSKKVLKRPSSEKSMPAGLLDTPPSKTKKQETVQLFGDEPPGLDVFEELWQSLD